MTPRAGGGEGATRAIDGFYAVLDRDDEELARKLASVACVLQVRLKPAGARVDAAVIARVARMARRICDAAGIALVVNDRIDIALAVGADGVHLGQTDLPVAAARALVGDRLWLGVSTHDLAQVTAACSAGADYLGFGPVFATATKRNPDPVQGIAGLRAACAVATRPIVAIGGITPASAAMVYGAGAAALCAIGAVNESPDVLDAGRRLRRASGSARA